MRLTMSILLALGTLFSPAAFADHNDLKSAAEFEREDAILGFIGFDREDYENFEDFVKIFDRDRHGDDRWGRPGRDHRRDDHRWDRDRHRRGYVCFAENRRGERFRGYDRSAREAQREALRRCERVSRRCEALGCRRDR